MNDLFLLSVAQMRRIEPYFPLSHGIARVDDRRVISGIIFVIKNGLRWRDAPSGYGPHKTIYDSFMRRSCLGAFNMIFSKLACIAAIPLLFPAGTIFCIVCSLPLENVGGQNAV